MRLVDTVFFDLDGTLTDPKVGITQSIRYAFGQLGLDAPEADQLTWCIGPPLLQSFREMLGDQQKARAALEFYRERFSDEGLYENEVYQGIPDALQRLSAEGITLYVTTSKPKVFAERIVEHFGLGPFFGAVYGAGLDGALADKTELIRYAIAGSGADPARTVMVGDRRHDMLGARQNDIAAAGVLYGYGSKAELLAAGAQCLIGSPGEIASLAEISPGIS